MLGDANVLLILSVVLVAGAASGAVAKRFHLPIPAQVQELGAAVAVVPGRGGVGVEDPPARAQREHRLGGVVHREAGQQQRLLGALASPALALPALVEAACVVIGRRRERCCHALTGFLVLAGFVQRPRQDVHASAVRRLLQREPRGDEAEQLFPPNRSAVVW